MADWNLPWAYRPRAAKPSPLDNPDFRFWFGNSVIVNADGTPRIVYHGTTARGMPRRSRLFAWDLVPPAFTVFEPGREDIGIHFGTKEQAESRASGAFGRDRLPWEVEGHVYPVYIRLENPIRMYDTGQWYPADIAERLEDRWPRPKFLAPENGPPILSERETARVLFAADEEGHMGARVELVHYLKAHGYDGIVYQNLYEGNKKDDSYIVFDPTQIKSAYGNRGTYDPRDPDILHGF